MKLSLMLGLIGLLLTPGWVDAQDVQDPLPSWNNSAAKQSIVSFVEKVSKEGSADFVPANERIATFDNDGCLWAEQPPDDEQSLSDFKRVK